MNSSDCGKVSPGLRSDCPEGQPHPVTFEARVEETARWAAQELRHALPPRFDRWFGRFVVHAFRRQLGRFAGNAIRFDEMIAEEGFAGASRWMIRNTKAVLEVRGAHGLPVRGPLAIAANHPGLLDALAIAGSLPREDFRIVAEEHPLWGILNQARQRMLLIGKSPQDRPRAARQLLRHLRGGGCLLLFPSGKIDPDPAVHGVGQTNPADWSASLDLVCRTVPGVTVVPALVSGVLSPSAMSHPLARLQPDLGKRRWLAATLEFLNGADAPFAMSVQYGEPCILDRGK